MGEPRRTRRGFNILRDRANESGRNKKDRWRQVSCIDSAWNKSQRDYQKEGRISEAALKCH